MSINGVDVSKRIYNNCKAVNKQVLTTVSHRHHHHPHHHPHPTSYITKASYRATYHHHQPYYRNSMSLNRILTRGNKFALLTGLL